MSTVALTVQARTPSNAAARPGPRRAQSRAEMSAALSGSRTRAGRRAAPADHALRPSKQPPGATMASVSARHVGDKYRDGVSCGYAGHRLHRSRTSLIPGAGLSNGELKRRPSTSLPRSFPSVGAPSRRSASAAEHEFSIRVATALWIPCRIGLVAGDRVLDADRRRQLLVFPRPDLGVARSCHLVLPPPSVTQRGAAERRSQRGFGNGLTLPGADRATCYPETTTRACDAAPGPPPRLSTRSKGATASPAGS